MKTVTCLAPAKVNLGLDVIGIRPDGYHELETVFQTISIYDKLTVTRDNTASGITLHCDTPDIPCDHTNLVWKAAARFQAAANCTDGIMIMLEKQIPAQAGLGGGSSDAAAMLLAMQKLYENPLPQTELEKIAVSLGADVPFLLYGGTAYAAGVGERLAPLPPFTADHLVIAKGKQGVSTGEAYRNIDALVHPLHPPVSSLRRAIQDGKPLTEIAKHCGNLFEQAVSLPEADQIRTIMRENGAQCSVMTGSGSAVFGIFETRAEAKAACCALQKLVSFVVLCKTVRAQTPTLETPKT